MSTIVTIIVLFTIIVVLNIYAIIKLNKDLDKGITFTIDKIIATMLINILITSMCGILCVYKFFTSLIHLCNL